MVLTRADKPADDSRRYGRLRPKSNLKIRVFIDTSSIEFFINDGELVFSERYYASETPQIFLNADQPVKVNIIGYTLAK